MPSTADSTRITAYSPMCASTRTSPKSKQRSQHLHEVSTAHSRLAHQMQATRQKPPNGCRLLEKHRDELQPAQQDPRRRAAASILVGIWPIRKTKVCKSSNSASFTGTCSSATLTVASWTRCTRRLYPPATERVRRLSATERNRQSHAHQELHTSVIPTSHRKGPYGYPTPKGKSFSYSDLLNRFAHPTRIRQPSSQHLDTGVAREASWNRSFVREHSAGRRSPNNRGKAC
jgi:hypothetical protein